MDGIIKTDTERLKADAEQIKVLVGSFDGLVASVETHIDNIGKMRIDDKDAYALGELLSGAKELREVQAELNRLSEYAAEAAGKYAACNERVDDVISGIIM